MSSIEAVLAELRRIVGDHHVRTDDLDAFSRDWTGRFIGDPSAVVRPSCTQEVSEVVSTCARSGVAVIAQGGNTGLVGGTKAEPGQVIVNLGRLDWVGEVDVVDRQLLVGAGATLEAVQKAALAKGLRYPVDFGARGSATIGGSIATNAGGINVVRYGSTRRQLAGFEAVLANGEVMSHLGGLVKDNTGYDLASLMCGSEGTLGVITAAVVNLVPIHAFHTTILMGFESVDEAVAMVARLCSQLDSIDAAELFVRRGAQLVSAAFDVRIPFDAEVYVLCEVASNSDQTGALEGVIAESQFAGPTALATDEVGRRKLWRLREEHTPAIATLGTPHKFDVSVSVSRLPAFIESVEQLVASTNHQWQCFIFGHAADGNMHVNVVGPEIDDESIDDLILNLVARFEGSISAEHGIGSAKKHWLHLSRSTTEIATMRAIKQALDPRGIMNPNNLFG